MESKDTKIEIELNWEGKLKIESIIRGFGPVLMDDKKKGESSAPSPVEMFLSSIASCMAMSFLYCCQLSRIKMKTGDIKIKVSGRLGRVENRLRLVCIEVEFIINSGKEDSKVQKCFDKFQSFCILSESIKPAIPLDCKLSLVN